MSEDRKLSILGHLLELRKRVTYSVIAVAVASAVSFFFVDRVIQFLIRPLEGTRLVFTELTQMLGVYFTVGFICGLALALPFIVYQFAMFVAPALTPKEKRYVYSLMPAVFVAFFVGAGFAYFVLIPPAMKFLVTFGTDMVTPLITINSYINLVTKLLLAIGLVFEMPIIVFFLAKIHVVTGKFLAKQRRWAIMGAFLLGAVITPTFDPVNQALVAAPIIVLYEISIWLARLARAGEGKKARAAEAKNLSSAG